MNEQPIAPEHGAAYLNQLHQADALQFARNLLPESIDMLLTDPPYSSGGLHSSARRQGTGKKYISNTTKTAYVDFDFDQMDQRSWAFWCGSWLSAAWPAIKRGGLVVLFIDWRQLPTLTDVMQASGFTLQGIAVWDKTNGGARPRNGGLKQQAEFIVWATKGSLPANDVYLPGVFQAKLTYPKLHQTEKPLEIAKQIVRLVPPGGVVCDLFAGSGTFLVAAKEAGLAWTGCELNAGIYPGTCERLAA